MIEKILSETDQLGVIGSPSSTTELALDVIGSAVMKKLVGELAVFQFQQDNSAHYAMGQITEVQLRNVWHEDPTIRSLIRQRGRIDAVSERQDTHLGKMTVSAVFRESSNGRYEPGLLGTVPATGTPIKVVTDSILDEVLAPYQSQMFYLGHVYGSTPRLPMWFKHFDSGPDGNGEAYHIGIFGKTGSGKSGLAKMILAGYARYPKMSMLILDPQGEFTKDFRGEATTARFSLPLKQIAEKSKKKTVTLNARNLVLDRWDLFQEILYDSLFFERLTIPDGENRRLACEMLSDRLKKAKVCLDHLHERTSFDQAWKILKDEKTQKVFYRTEGSRSRFDTALNDASEDEFYNDYWKPVCELFRADRKDARTVEKALSWLLDANADARPILIIDLSSKQAEGLLWNDRIQSLIIKRILDGLKQTAEHVYQEGKSLNALVVIDEAHRLAPAVVPQDDDTSKRVRDSLVDAVRTTRKYGLGWMFVSQTLSSIHAEISQQMRIYFFGFGLALGQEYQSLRQLVGTSGPALNLYQLFRDPQSAFDAASKQFSFMAIGPVSPLAFTSTPLFFNAFNTSEAFLRVNHLP